MNSKIYFMVVSLSAIFLVGCEKTPKSEDWYKDPANYKTLKSVLADCQKSGDDTKDCQNAKMADYRLKQANAPIPTFDSNGKVLTKEQARKEKTFYPINGVSFPKSLEGLTPEDVKDWKNKNISRNDLKKATEICRDIKEKDIKIDEGCEEIRWALMRSL